MNIGQEAVECGSNAAAIWVSIPNIPLQGHDPAMSGPHLGTNQTGAAPMSFFSDITFLDVTLSLIALGVIERLLYRLPETMVGPGGWLLDTGVADEMTE